MALAVAWAHRSTGIDLEWLAGHLNLALVAVAGVAAAAATWAMGAGLVGSAAAGAVVMAWWPLAVRSVRWGFDTDLGIVAWTLAAGAAAWATARGRTRARRAGWLAVWGLAAAGLWSWWDQARAAAAGMALLPLAGAVALGWRGGAREAWAVGTGVAVAGGIAAWWMGGVEAAWETARGLVAGRIPGEAPGWAEATGLGAAGIAELAPAEHWGWWVLVVVAVLWRRRWRALVVVGGVPIAMALAGAWLGVRGLMWWAVPAAWAVAGIAMLRHPRAEAGCALAGLLVVGTQWGSGWASEHLLGAGKGRGLTPAPAVWRALAGTPADTVVYARWDRASRVMLRAGRATVVDEQHPGARRQAIAGAVARMRTEAGAGRTLRLLVARGPEGLMAAGAGGGETGPERLEAAIERLDGPVVEARPRRWPGRTADRAVRWRRAGGGLRRRWNAHWWRGWSRGSGRWPEAGRRRAHWSRR